MTAYGWLLIGAVIGLGHWAASALPVIGGVCVVLTVIRRAASPSTPPRGPSGGRSGWSRSPRPRPDDTAPLTVYEEAVFALLTGTQDRPGRTGAANDRWRSGLLPVRAGQPARGRSSR